MKRFAFIVAGCAALACLAYFGMRGGAQDNNKVVPASGSAAATKIGVVNLAMVLKKFNQANFLGDQLLEEAQTEESRLKSERASLAKQETELALIPDMKQREEKGKQIRAQTSALAEKEIEARKKFADRQANMAKDVYTKFKAVIDTVAKTYNLDLVISYPDATSSEEENSPQQAFRMLSAPGAMILWKNPNLDITEIVVKYLNHNFPAPPDYKPGTKPAGALSPTPMR